MLLYTEFLFEKYVHQAACQIERFLQWLQQQQNVLIVV